MTKSQPESNEDNNESKFVTVLKTGSLATITVAQSVLNSAKINSYIKNETVQSLFGLGGIGGFNPLMGPMELQVESDNYEEAKELLSEFV
jgi:hypothetical protein